MMKLLRLLFGLLLLSPLPAQAWTSAVPHLNDSPFMQIYFPHGFISGVTPPSALSKTVAPLPLGNDQYMNLAKGMNPTLSGSLTPANLNNDGFPSGVLPSNMRSSTNGWNF